MSFERKIMMGLFGGNICEEAPVLPIYLHILPFLSNNIQITQKWLHVANSDNLCSKLVAWRTITMARIFKFCAKYYNNVFFLILNMIQYSLKNCNLIFNYCYEFFVIYALSLNRLKITLRWSIFRGWTNTFETWAKRKIQ